MKNFGLIGASGYIAPKHMKAIKETNNQLVAGLDPYDGIGIMDSYFPQASFFTEFERFDRFVDKCRRQKKNKIEFMSIATPNYLHDAHIRFALRSEANAICEKPLVLNPHNLEQLKEQLIDFHSIDYDDHFDEDEEYKPIKDFTLENILSWGDWSYEWITNKEAKQYEEDYV